MRALFASVTLVCAALLAGASAGGEKKDKEAKEVKLVGKICCAKCELSEGADCATVIVVTKDKKDVVYFFDKKGHEKHHDAICAAALKGFVVGTVSTEGKKQIITIKSLEFNK